MVTRTLHYGAPTPAERRAYTTALRALAALSTLQLPAALPAAHADLAARAPLWAARQDYVHPTGHGVGAALNRREGNLNNASVTFIVHFDLARHTRSLIKTVRQDRTTRIQSAAASAMH